MLQRPPNTPRTKCPLKSRKIGIKSCDSAFCVGVRVCLCVLELTSVPSQTGWSIPSSFECASVSVCMCLCVNAVKKEVQRTDMGF